MAQQMKTFNGDALGIIFVILIPAVIGYLISIISLYGGIGVAVILFLILLAAAIRIVNQWNRKAVLSFGKYVGMMGPGIHIIIPFVQTTPLSLDLRVINTIFKAERTLTKDNVPVDVDALLFWRVVNSEDAVLNVQIYRDSVQLAAQTALRDIIGKTDLSEMLAGRDVIGKDVKNLIEERVTNWGIEAISVEIRDVSIPAELQDAMARVAVAEREKQARVKLAESESLAADKMIEASEKYKKDLIAMQLRSLNMMYEISLSGKNLMVFIPTDSKGFSIPTPLGIEGMLDAYKKNNLKSDNTQSNKSPTDKDNAKK
ncbi:MAG: slipin family protein [Candidatus Parvarchaeum sp.]